MRRSLPVFACIWLLASAPALADSNTQTDVGALAALVVGTHVGSDNPVPVSGVVPGAVLEVTQHFDRLRLHLEGIPTVGATGSNTGPFGHSSASLALLNSTLMVDVDPQRRFRLGGGVQIIDLTSTNGSNGDVSKSTTATRTRAPRGPSLQAGQCLRASGSGQSAAVRRRVAA